MAKRTPPKIAADKIPERQVSELDHFLEGLYYRISTNIEHLDAGKINAQWVAFEALGAILPALAQGLTHKEVKSAYPVSSWRNETVEVPVEVLSVLVSSWNEYVDNNKTLGQSFGFEKLNRQGAPAMKTVRRNLDKSQKLSNRVLREHVQIGDEDPKSLEEVLHSVAVEFGVSAKTVERAYKEHGQRTFDRVALPQTNSIPDKTSGSGGVDE